MAIIKWRESYNTGIEQIDREHHKLVELIEKMYTVVRHRSASIQVENALVDLEAYTEYHFGNEEALMYDYLYPDMQQHKQQHAILRGRVEAFREKADGAAGEMNQELYHFLRNWLLTHILESDKRFTDFVLKGKR